MAYDIIQVCISFEKNFVFNNSHRFLWAREYSLLTNREKGFLQTVSYSSFPFLQNLSRSLHN